MFSSAVSRFLLDGVEHWRFRSLIDRYLTPEIVAGLEPLFHDVAKETLRWDGDGVGRRDTDAIELGVIFTVRAMTAWLGWPRELEPRLVAWVGDNTAASRSRDTARTATVTSVGIRGDRVHPAQLDRR